MDFRQLQTFVQVAELGSFTRAAHVLQVAQPALSRQVRALEVELRQALFVRNGRGVTLTEAGTRLLAHARGITWAGPMACYDFGRESGEHGEKSMEAVDDVTRDCFLEAMRGELEAVGFRTDAGFDGLDVKGTLWGGNLCMVASLLATPHWPRIKGGVLFLEDVNEHPYRVERMLLQLQQAGVLDAQKAVLLGAFSDFRASPLDRGYTLRHMVAQLRQVTRTPILTGLPFGHVPTKVSLPVGAKVQLVVQARDVLLGW
jgi:muramoyltetrapeptide carboxypeptidase